MSTTRSLKRRLSAMIVTASLVPLISCGTLLYPKRDGQRRDRVDPAVLVMDGALLFLFVLPGLVAFAIDFHTGAIYLPGKGQKVSVLRVNPDELTVSRIEETLREHSGADVRLDDSSLRLYRLGPGTNPEEALRRLSFEPTRLRAAN